MCGCTNEQNDIEAMKLSALGRDIYIHDKDFIDLGPFNHIGSTEKETVICQE